MSASKRPVWLRRLFLVGAAIWILGGLTALALVRDHWVMARALRFFAVDVAGTLTLLSGALLGVRWLVQKFASRFRTSASVACDE